MQEEIVKYFFEQGKLLTPQTLEKMIKNQELIKKEYSDFIIEKTDNIKILKIQGQKLKEVKTQDFVNFYKSKYEKMKDIITSRIKKDFVSLNNIQNDCYVIGIVKNIKDNEIEIEDMTETKKIKIENLNNLELDDVAAFHVKNNICIEVLYPDIQLRPPTTSYGKVCFISNPDEVFFIWFEKQGIDNLFIDSENNTSTYLEKYCKNKNIFTTTETKKSILLTKPSIVEINKVKILVTDAFNLMMIKKRYLGKSNNIFKEDFLVMDEIPDIVYTDKDNKITNYKSITIINSKNPVIVDFSTREAKIIDDV